MAYCPLPLCTHTRKHLTPYCLRAKRSNTTVDARSTTGTGPWLKFPRHSAISNPSYFSPGGDLREWHKKVGRWVNLLKTSHDSEKNRYCHKMFKIVGQTLYTRGLPREHRSNTKKAQSNNIVDHMQNTDPDEAALDVENVVAVDLPIATRRLQSSYLLSEESKAAVGPREKSFRCSCLSFVDSLPLFLSTKIFPFRPNLVESSILNCSIIPAFTRVR